ncbi:MAG: hypothetical protein AAF560_00305 [Acidobacteriota bacterium]
MDHRLDSCASLRQLLASVCSRLAPLSLALLVQLSASPEASGQCQSGGYAAPRVVAAPGFGLPIVNGSSIPGFLTPALDYGDDFFFHGPPTFQPLIPAKPQRRAPACQPAGCPNPPIIIIQQPAARRPAPEPVATYAPPVAPVAAPAPIRNPNARDTTPKAPGQLYLWIQQSEAFVSLDGHDLGTGADIDALDLPIEISSGVHVLVTQHPDYGSERLVFSVPEGEEILVEINLSGNRSGRKARIRNAHEIAARLPRLRR